MQLGPHIDRLLTYLGSLVPISFAEEAAILQSKFSLFLLIKEKQIDGLFQECTGTFILNVPKYIF
jgi:hypothetical protein